MRFLRSIERKMREEKNVIKDKLNVQKVQSSEEQQDKMVWTCIMNAGKLGFTEGLENKMERKMHKRKTKNMMQRQQTKDWTGQNQRIKNCGKIKLIEQAKLLDDPHRKEQRQQQQYCLTQKLNIQSFPSSVNGLKNLINKFIAVNTITIKHTESCTTEPILTTATLNEYYYH